MEYRRLGRHGVLVSRLCLGTMNFGSQADEAESFAIMDRALELGINFFDTSNSYGTPRGLTEEIVGRWLAQGGGRRDAIVLATKVHNQTGKLARPEANHDTPGLSALKIRRHLEASLARLRTDRVDLYQMHHVDRACPWDEIWQAMGSLADQGRIVYVGSSNFAGWDIATACQEAARRGRVGLASEQSVYSLVNRTVELEVIPACRHYGLGLVCWSPLAGGLLAGAPAADGAGRRGSTAPPRNARGAGSRWRPGNGSAAASGRSRPSSRSRGCSRTPWCRRRSSGRARSRSSRAPCARSVLRWTPKPSRSSTRSSPGPGEKPRTRTPGRRRPGRWRRR